MSEPAKTGIVPAILLINGDDEFAIAQYLAKIQADLGDASVLAMNLNRIDGRSFNPDELLSIAAAMPFLSKRRLVIYEHPTARLEQPGGRSGPPSAQLKERVESLPTTWINSR